MKRDTGTLDVIISSPDETIWKGKEVQSISSENSTGPFDILPEHSNFITLVKDSPIIVRAKDYEKTFSYKNSVILVRGADVQIYVDI